MAAKNLKSLGFFILLLIISSWLLVTEARPPPLNVAAKSSGDFDRGIEMVIDGLYIGAVKTGGPSPGGKGHESTNAQTFGVIKNSGPSPGGKGHESTNAQTFEVIKNSGSSPGEGH